MLKLNLWFRLVAVFLLSSTCFTSLVQSTCNRGCDLALGSYYTESGTEIVSISQIMNTSTSDILMYNRNTIPNLDSLPSYTRINVPFSCDCINVNCSCGDISISKDYGLFLTYPLRVGETLDSISSAANLRSELVRRYNPDVNFSQGSGLIYIPGRDKNGNYPPLKTSSEPGLSSVAIDGITVGVLAIVLFFAGCLYNKVFRKKIAKTNSVLLQNAQVQAPNGSSITGITIEKSIEFSYEELSTATDDFSPDNKIGQGGFGAVYCADLSGEKVAIKKMDMKASRQFIAELKVLTHTHHVNLVRLIGYCVEGSLFLVYEYIENGNLSQHLHESERDTLSWSTRVQIARDSARGIEYIHEHTDHVHIHCDIKSANILIDKNFHGKVADFGLTRLTVVGSRSRLAGTFGYMPPEYVQYGDVSPKVDVFAFGVVLYELISAKKAIIRPIDPDDEPKSLIALFDEVFTQSDPLDELVKLIDPRLGDNYPLDSVHKMARLAKACTHEDPRQRPSMRYVAVALLALSSSTEDLDVSSLNENQILMGFMPRK